MSFRTNRRTKKRFPVGPQRHPDPNRDNYYENARTFRDPLEAVNDLMRKSEDDLGTSHHAETGEITSYSDDSEQRDIDLGNEKNQSYPSHIAFNVDIPDSQGHLWSLNGVINRTLGGWKAGANLTRLRY